MLGSGPQLGSRPQGLPESVKVHPMALVESADIGASTRIWGFAHVLPGARIGAHCNLCEHVFVENTVRMGNGVTVKNGISLWNGLEIEDDVFIGPHAVFTNDLRPRAFKKKDASELVGTRIEKGATIGAGATILCGITIGRYSFIAAGSVVTKSVPPFAVVRGNPARHVGYACFCAEKIFSLDSGVGPETSCGVCGPAVAHRGPSVGINSPSLGRV